MRRASRDFVRALQSDGHKADSRAEVKVRLQIYIKVCDVGGHSKPWESRRGVQEGSVSRAEQREGLRRRAARACACAPVRPRSSSRPHRKSTPWESAAGGQPRGPVAQPERALGPYIYRLMRAEAPCHDTYQAFDDPPNKTGYRVNRTVSAHRAGNAAEWGKLHSTMQLHFLPGRIFRYISSL